MTLTFEIEILEGVIVEAVLERTSPGFAARISGPPEDCYPAEAAEYNIVRWEWNDREISLHDALSAFYEPEAANRELARCITDVFSQADQADWTPHQEYDPEERRERLRLVREIEAEDGFSG